MSKASKATPKNKNPLKKKKADKENSKNIGIQNVYVGQQMITRSTDRLLQKNGITNDFFVAIDKNCMADCLAWLDRAPCGLPVENVEQGNRVHNNRDNVESALIPSNKAHKRRMSVAGSSLFSVNNQTQEAGSDYMQKILRPSLLSSIATISNMNSNISELQKSNGSEGTKSTIDAADIGDATASGSPNNIVILSSITLPIRAKVSNERNEHPECAEHPKNDEVRVNGKNVGVLQSTRMNDDHAIPGTSGISTSLTAPSMKLTVQNDFDPFRRVKNPPFNLGGRPRASSQHERGKYWQPALATVYEEVGEDDEKAVKNQKKKPPQTQHEHDALFGFNDNYKCDMRNYSSI